MLHGRLKQRPLPKLCVIDPTQGSADKSAVFFVGRAGISHKKKPRQQELAGQLKFFMRNPG